MFTAVKKLPGELWLIGIAMVIFLGINTPLLLRFQESKNIATELTCAVHFSYPDEKPYEIYYAKHADYDLGQWTLVTEIRPEKLILEKADYYFKFQKENEIANPVFIECVADKVWIEVK